MNSFSKFLIICLLVVIPAMLHAQSTEKLDISLTIKNNDKWRELTPIVKKGSGEYLYLWISSAKYGIASDRSSKTATIPLDEEDIKYQVFVRDQKTGALGHKSINFSKINDEISPIAYPNPSKGEVTVSLIGNEDIILDNSHKIIKAELYSEHSGRLVKSLDLPSKDSEELKVSTNNLQPGVYYVHLWINDNVHSQALKKEIRLLVEK